MRTIFSTESLPPKRLHVESTLTNMAANQAGSGSDRLFHMVKEQMARQLAEKIMTDVNFFSVKFIPSTDLFRFRADCIVVTQDEWRDAMEAAFRQGVENGMYGNFRHI